MAIANKSGVADGGLSTASKNQSIFPAQNFELVYKQWEDDIIYDSDAVDHLPRPSLPLIDPNDPNYILGIPEEPPPSVTADKDKKVDLCSSIWAHPCNVNNNYVSGYKKVSIWIKSF